MSSPFGFTISMSLHLLYYFFLSQQHAALHFRSSFVSVSFLPLRAPVEAIKFDFFTIPYNVLKSASDTINKLFVRINALNKDLLHGYFCVHNRTSHGCCFGGLPHIHLTRLIINGWVSHLRFCIFRTTFVAWHRARQLVAEMCQTSKLGLINDFSCTIFSTNSAYALIRLSDVLSCILRWSGDKSLSYILTFQ
jgi:hypothetical protein